MNPSNRPSANASLPEPSQEDVAWSIEMLCSIWEHQQELVNERIALIARAIGALEQDHLDVDLRAGAQHAAHLLAGSVGIFGFLSASRAARSLEVKLAHAKPQDAPELSALLLSLRDELRGPVVLH